MVRTTQIKPAHTHSNAQNQAIETSALVLVEYRERKYNTCE